MNPSKAKSVTKEAKQANVGKSAVIEMKAVQKEQPTLADDLIAGKTTVVAGVSKSNNLNFLGRLPRVTVPLRPYT